MGKKQEDDAQQKAAAHLQEMRDAHWTDDRREELQFGEQSNQSKNDVGDLGAFMVRDCTNAQDVAAVIKKDPQFTRQIYLAAIKLLGMQTAKEAVKLAQSPDASVTVDNRGTLNTTAEDSFGDRTAPNPGSKLPWFTKESWNGFEINSKLGQYDLIAGTDSDGARCGFANAIAVKVLDGPGATLKWLEKFIQTYEDARKAVREKEAAKTGKEPEGPTKREVAAKDVISAVYGAIKDGIATWGDLSWLQEAMHDWSFENEKQGVATTGAMAVGMDHETLKPPVVAASAADLAKMCTEALGTDERLFFEWQIFSDEAEERAKHFVVIANVNGTNYIYDSEAQKTKDGGHMTALTKDTAKKFFPNKYCRMFSDTKVRGANAKPANEAGKAK